MFGLASDLRRPCFSCACLKHLVSQTNSPYSSPALSLKRFALCQRFDLSFGGELLLSVEASIPQSSRPRLLQFLIAEAPRPSGHVGIEKVLGLVDACLGSGEGGWVHRCCEAD